MPFINVNNTRLFYRLEGRAALPVLVLSHSLGCDHGMWEPQMPDLLEHFRVLRYDTRGHGASDVPKGDADSTVEELGRDVVELAGALGVKKFAFCGLSMGGAIGQWLAIYSPALLSRLVLSNTSPRFGTRDAWEERLQALREGGMKAIAETAMQRFFAPNNQASTFAQSVRAVLLGTDPRGYAACCAALRDVNHNGMLGRISIPTLVIAGQSDPSTPWEGNGEILAREIPGATAVRLPGAHLSNMEQPRSYTAALLEFLLQEGAGDPLEAGLRVRRRVLGDAHVDSATDTTTDFNRDFQTLITRYAWGAIWTRPGLDERTRRLLVLAMTPALGRWEEFRLHLRAALSHGMEPCDVKEVLLQVAIYAGVPAANTGFQIAREELNALETETP